MDAVYNMIITVITWLVDFVMNLFNVIFFWLPDDFIIGYIDNLHTIVSANLLALKWLNWFIDVPFFVTVFGLAVTALLAWTAFQIFNYIFKRTIGMISFFTP